MPDAILEQSAVRWLARQLEWERVLAVLRGAAHGDRSVWRPDRPERPAA